MDANSAPTVTPPTGFTAIVTGTGTTDNGRLWVFRKVSDGSEGGSVSATISTAKFGAKGAIAYSGVDNTTPEDVASTTNTNAAATATPAQTSQTTVTDGARIVAFFARRGVSGYTGTADASPAANELVDQNFTEMYVFIEDYAQPSLGAIALDATISSSLDFWARAQVALRPAAAGEFFTKAVTVSFVP